MSNFSNNQHRSRSFERHVKLLLEELEFFGTNIKQGSQLHGWMPSNDVRRGLEDLEGAISSFTKSLSVLLTGNKFWMSDVVTDRSGVRDLKDFKPDIELLQTRVARAMDNLDQSRTLDELTKAKVDVETMAEDFEKLRESMLRRNLQRAAHASDTKSEVEPISPISQPTNPVKENKETMIEAEPYGEQKYLWLVLGTLIFGKALLTHIPHMILFALLLHLIPAFRLAQAKYLSRKAASKKSFQETAANCPAISMIEKSHSKIPSREQAGPQDGGRAPSISITAPNDHTAPIVAEPSGRTQEHVGPRNGANVAFAVSGMDGGGTSTPTVRPRRLSVNGNISS